MLLPLLLIFLLGVIIATIFSLNALVNTLRFGLPFVSTPGWAIDWLADQLPLSGSDVVCELGCGDARVLMALAKKNPQAKFIGLEVQWWPWLLAKWRTRKLTNVTIQLQNFLTADLSNVTIFYGFFITAIMPKVAAKLAEHLDRDAELISFGFALPGRESTREIASPTGKGSKIRLYQKRL